MTKSVPLLALLLAGCATYRPLPLEQQPEMLTSPAAAVLSQEAAKIDRPYLHPVAIDLAQPLDLNAVAVLAVVAGPDLKAQRARAGVADAQAFAARLLPDPTLQLGFDKLLSGPDSFNALAGALATDLNALRTRAAVRAQADTAASQVRLDFAWAEWQAAGQARIQAVRAVALERQATLTRANMAASQSLLDRSLRAATRGDIAGDQVQAARTAALDASERLRTADSDLLTARSELHKLLGLAPDVPLRLAPAPLPAAPPAVDRLFAIAQAQRLDLKALQAGYASQEAAVRKAILDQFPTLTLTVNGARDTSNNRTLGPAIDFTLPLWNRNRGGIAVERATRAALKAEYDVRLFQTRAEITAAVNGIALAQRQRAMLAPQITPLAQTAAASRRAEARGDISAAAAAAAEGTLRDRQITLAALDQAIIEQTIALELLTGAPQESWK